MHQNAAYNVCKLTLKFFILKSAQVGKKVNKQLAKSHQKIIFKLHMSWSDWPVKNATNQSVAQLIAQNFLYRIGSFFRQHNFTERHNGPKSLSNWGKSDSFLNVWARLPSKRT